MYIRVSSCKPSCPRLSTVVFCSWNKSSSGQKSLELLDNTRNEEAAPLFRASQCFDRRVTWSPCWVRRSSTFDTEKQQWVNEIYSQQSCGLEFSSTFNHLKLLPFLNACTAHLECKIHSNLRISCCSRSFALCSCRRLITLTCSTIWIRLGGTTLAINLLPVRKLRKQNLHEFFS